MRAASGPLAGFSEPFYSELLELKSFLFRRMYRHPRVMQAMEGAQKALADLFGAFMADPSRLPEEWAAECGKPDDAKTARAVCDYIAGMTDRFALQEYKRIFLVEFPL